MNQIEALQQLRMLATPVVESRDVAALLQITTSNATTILRRLASKSMILHLSRGRWLVNEKIDRFSAYFTPSRAAVSRDAGPAFHLMSGHHFTHAGPVPHGGFH
jgi:predicted transcriptional regulator of viral defense system